MHSNLPLLAIVSLSLLVGNLTHAAQNAVNPETRKGEAERLYREGKYRQSMVIIKQILEYQQQTLGSNHPSTAVSLNNLAVLYCAIGNYNEGERIYRRALSIEEKVLPSIHPEIATTLNGLAFLYDSKGDGTAAEPLFLRALAIRENHFGPDHVQTAVSLNHLGELYLRTGRYAEAEPLLGRALKIRETELGAAHGDTAGTLLNVARLKKMLGRYVEAGGLYLRAWTNVENAFGPNHRNTGVCLADVAAFYETTGDYLKSKPLLLRALEVYQKTLGAEHDHTIGCKIELANLCRRMGDFGEAEDYYLGLLDVREKTMRQDHRSDATVIAGLAKLNESKGRYDRAEPLYQKALLLTEGNVDENQRTIAARLKDIGSFYVSMGDYAKAEPLLLRALQVREKLSGREHPTTAAVLGDLAELYRKIADYTKAESYYLRALRIEEKAYGQEHPTVAVSLHNLAVFYREIGSKTNVEPLFRRALRIHEKAYGPSHLNVAMILNNLASDLSDRGETEVAEATYLRALAIFDSGALLDHPDEASCLHNLGMLYHRAGADAKAMAAYERAAAIRERSLGLEHPETAVTLRNLGFVLLNLGHRHEAEAIATKVRQATLKNVSNILSFTSERQRLEYQRHRTIDPLLPIALENTREIALALLRYRGVVLDSLLEDKAVAESTDNSTGRVLMENQRIARQRLFQLNLELQTGSDNETHARRLAERAKLWQEIEQCEASLALQMPRERRSRRALGVTIEQVQQALPEGTLLVEVVRYGWPLGTNQWEERYGAVTLAAVGEPQWKVLGKASVVDTNIALYRRSLRSRSSQSDFSAVLRSLYEQIWRPFTLPAGIKTVIISADGELNFLSFATLLTPDDQFIGEKYSIRYVATGRDLLSESKLTPSQQMVVYADPRFSGKASPVAISSNFLATLSSVERGDLQSLHLAPLPGTARESAALETQAWKWKQPVQTFLADQASEANLRSMVSPHVLHLATHGFFLNDSTPDSATILTDVRGVGGLRPLVDPIWKEEVDRRSRKPVMLKSPMHRSGLALAGAQTTLDSWQRGEVPATDDDGIVTAEEVGSLKLSGTWLVTLSACDTGTGEARSGEGVMGLRRGFIQAGAQNLLMTLWAVADEETVGIMVDFYEAAHRTANAPQALADVQRDWLVKLRKEQGLQAAVRLAGPFIMSSQGPNK